MKQSLSRNDRLKSYKRIRLLFASGEKFRVSPLLLYYRIVPEAQQDGSNLKMGVSVGARHFKRAVDRNLLKRRVREAYRKQKQPLSELLASKSVTLDLFWVYLEPKIVEYAVISDAITKGLDQLITRLSK